jgi:hypothetical protein
MFRMSSFRKYFLPLSIVVLTAFLAILTIEGSHHHDNFESNDNCSFCSFQQTASHAPSIAQPPTLFPFFVVVAPVVFSPLFIHITIASARGRSPPVLL